MGVFLFYKVYLDLKPTMYEDCLEDDKVIYILSKVGLEDYASSKKLDMLIHEGGTHFWRREKGW